MLTDMCRPHLLGTSSFVSILRESTNRVAVFPALRREILATIMVSGILPINVSRFLLFVTTALRLNWTPVRRSIISLRVFSHVRVSSYCLRFVVRISRLDSAMGLGGRFNLSVFKIARGCRRSDNRRPSDPCRRIRMNIGRWVSIVVLLVARLITII